MPEICRRFSSVERPMKRGYIQALQTQAQNNAGMVAAFCERLYWSDMSLLFQRVGDRLALSVAEDLLGLTQVPSLKPQRARMLAKQGISTVMELLERCQNSK